MSTAAKDAVDLGQAIRVAAERLFGADRVNVQILSTQEGVGIAAPTRENLVSALQQVAAQATPEDVVLVYLAGHGVTHGGRDGDYYFLTQEARSGALDDTAIRATAALSSLELTDLMNLIPALKQVLILDTCGAGRVTERLTEDRAVSSSQIRAMQRLKDRTGTFVLAGSPAETRPRIDAPTHGA